MSITDGKDFDTGPASSEDIRKAQDNNVTPDIYKLLKDAYYGTGGFLDGDYLYQHQRESEFTTRKISSVYPNHFRPILDCLVDPVFKRPAERIYENEEYEEFEKNCDRNGTTLNEFMKKTAKRGKRDGCVFMILDTPSEQPISKADKMKFRTYPYVYLRYARDVVEYEVDGSRRLMSITFREVRGIQTKNKKNVYEYRKWFPGGWELYEKIEEGQLKNKIDERTIKPGVFNVIPIFFSGSEEGDSYLPHPPLYSIAKLGQSVYNVASELRDVQRKQGFSILAMPEGPSRNPSSVDIGASNILGYPYESKHKPDFINAEVEQQRTLIETENNLVKEMYRQGKIASVTGVIQQSGIAKEWDNEATTVELSNLARTCEYAESDLYGTYIQLSESGSEEFNARYPEEYGVFDIDQEITRTTNYLDAVGTWPEEVKKQALGDLTSNFFKHLEPKARADLIASIEKIAFDESYGNEDLGDAE